MQVKNSAKLAVLQIDLLRNSFLHNKCNAINYQQYYYKDV